MFTQTPQLARRPGLLQRSLTALDALVAPHSVQDYVELIVPQFASHEVRGRITQVERETADTVTLTVAPNRNWQGFTAGQHVLVTVEIEGVRHTRCYSMSSSPHRRDGRFQLVVKAHPYGTVSGHLMASAAVGDVLYLSEAQGTFTLPDERPQRLLLISGGSGITPVLSMLRTLCDEGHEGAITFLHYCLTADDQVAAADLDALAAQHPNVRVLRVFTEQLGAGDLDGFFDAAQLEKAEPAWREATVYVCGPAPLMDSVQRHYAEAGLAEQVEVEAFTLPLLVAEGGNAGGTVRFDASDLNVSSDGRTLLEQAEGAGLEPAHGCRMGICHTCTRTLRCGTVRNVVTGQVIDESDVPVRLCVNVPVGDVAIDL